MLLLDELDILFSGEVPPLVRLAAIGAMHLLANHGYTEASTARSSHSAGASSDARPVDIPAFNVWMFSLGAFALADLYLFVGALTRSTRSGLGESPMRNQTTGLAPWKSKTLPGSEPSMPRKRIFAPVVLLTAAAVGVGGVAAASGAPTVASSHSAASPALAQAAHTTKLRLTADPHGALRFNTKRLTARAGKVTIVMTNPSSSGMPHGVAIRGHGSGRVVGPGGTSTVTATLKRGTYTFLCPVPGHAQAGMTGTLTVR